MSIFRDKDYGGSSLEPKESALKHQSPQQTLHNDEQTKAWDPPTTPFITLSSQG